MARPAFINPATAFTYVWHRGYEAEEDAGKTRQVSGTANTGNTGRVRQQGDAGPYVRTLHGKIVHGEQHKQFWQFFELCNTQTIHFRDWDGAVYEVQITSLNMKQISRLPATAPDPGMNRTYYEWTLAMEVYAFVSGRMQTAGVSP